jgi:hypothetical protein
MSHKFLFSSNFKRNCGQGQQQQQQSLLLSVKQQFIQRSLFIYLFYFLKDRSEMNKAKCRSSKRKKRVA